MYSDVTGSAPNMRWPLLPMECRCWPGLAFKDKSGGVQYLVYSGVAARLGSRVVHDGNHSLHAIPSIREPQIQTAMYVGRFHCSGLDIPCLQQGCALV